MIKVSVNGQIQSIDLNITLKQLLVNLNYTTNSFAVAINTTFVPLDKYHTTIINDGDTIDILAPVQGG
jgi:sulfur carrier protein